MIRAGLSLLLLFMALAVVIFLLLQARVFRSGLGVGVIELPISWPSWEGGGWCGAGTRTASVELIVVRGCGGEDDGLPVLLRYWILMPSRGEREGSASLEVSLSGHSIYRGEVPMSKGEEEMYLHTPTLLLLVPRGARIQVEGNSLEVPGCAGSPTDRMTVLYARMRDHPGWDWRELGGGMRYARIGGGLLALTWPGRAVLSCDRVEIPLRELGEGEVGLLACHGGCSIRVSGSGKEFQLPAPG